MANEAKRLLDRLRKDEADQRIDKVRRFLRTLFPLDEIKEMDPGEGTVLVTLGETVAIDLASKELQVLLGQGLERLVYEDGRITLEIDPDKIK